MDKLTLKAADDGDADSQVLIGKKCLSEGKYNDAHIWFYRALLQRHPHATLQLSMMYFRGIGCRKSFGLAREGLQSLTELGTGPNLGCAYFPLYLCYLNLGEKEKADDILERGLRNNSPGCIRIIATKKNREGNSEESYKLFIKAAELGDFYSAYQAAIFPGKERNIPYLRYSSEGYWRGAKEMGSLIMRNTVIGEWRDAFSYYKKAYQLIDKENKVRSWLEKMIWWMERSFGKGEFDIVVGEDPYQNAWIYMDQKKFKEAFESFHECIVNEQFVGDASLNSGFLYLTGLGVEYDLFYAHEYISQSMLYLNQNVSDIINIRETVMLIRDMMEEKPEMLSMLHQVYKTEGNMIKTLELEKSMEID